MINVLGWFLHLTFDLMVFYTIALVASLVLLIQVAMMVLGVGDDLDAGMDAGLGDAGHPTGINLVSLRSLTGFFGGFGWTGVIALENGLSVLAASGLGAIVGAILTLSIAYLMTVLYSLQESGTIDYQNAIGKVATVYLPIPAKLSGAGQIRVMIQGRLTVVPTYTKVSDKIPVQAKVRVADLLDAGAVLVDLLDPETEKEKEARK